MLITEPILPRDAWPMVRIIETFPHSNVLVRTVRIHTKYSVITRPATKFCVIVSKNQN